MRIAIDIRPLLERNRAGVPTYTAEMTRALAISGEHEYALFLNAAGLTVPADIPSVSSRVSHHFSRYPNRLLNSGFAFLRAPKLEQLVGDVDAVYLPNLNFVATKKPTVVTVHDLSFVRYPRFFTPKQRLWHALVGAKKTLAGAAAIVAVSEHTKCDIIETFGISETRIHTVSPGVDARYAPQSQEEIERVRAKYSLPEKFFLYLGALEPRKNINAIIAAHEQACTDADFVIAGGKGWLYEKIFSRAAASKKRDRIRFIGYVDEVDKPGLYAAALSFVYPSFYEGFGMPPAEAMAVGTPVIASHATSLAEIVGDAGLLVDPYDHSELAAAMDAIAEQPTLAAHLRTKGFERAKKFTWESSAKKLADIFSSLRK